MNYTKEDIFQHIVDIMQEQFDIDPTHVTMEAKLREDLDIDSIDAVNLIIELKSLTGRKLPVENLFEIQCVDDVVNAVFKMLAHESENAA